MGMKNIQKGIEYATLPEVFGPWNSFYKGHMF